MGEGVQPQHLSMEVMCELEHRPRTSRDTRNVETKDIFFARNSSLHDGMDPTLPGLVFWPRQDQAARVMLLCGSCGDVVPQELLEATHLILTMRRRASPVARFPSDNTFGWICF